MKDKLLECVYKDKDIKSTFFATPEPDKIVIDDDLTVEWGNNQSTSFTIETAEGEKLVNEFF